MRQRNTNPMLYIYAALLTLVSIAFVLAYAGLSFLSLAHAANNLPAASSAKPTTSICYTFDKARGVYYPCRAVNSYSRA